jgi:hypothetical protein
LRSIISAFVLNLCAFAASRELCFAFFLFFVPFCGYYCLSLCPL